MSSLWASSLCSWDCDRCSRVASAAASDGSSDHSMCIGMAFGQSARAYAIRDDVLRWKRTGRPHTCSISRLRAFLRAV